MLNITNKTTRTDLIAEIQALRAQVAQEDTIHAAEVAKLIARIEAAEVANLTATRSAQNKAHQIEVLETDVQNLLGAMRVMADASRSVRIRRASVQDANLATALPYRNTEEL